MLRATGSHCDRQKPISFCISWPSVIVRTVRGEHTPPTSQRSEVSSTDPTTIGVHRALHEALNSAREARQRLDDGNAAPDLDDLVELGTLLAALSESVMAVNSQMMAKARLARGSNT
jgi:hypothetical protein